MIRQTGPVNKKANVRSFFIDKPAVTVRMDRKLHSHEDNCMRKTRSASQ